VSTKRRFELASMLRCIRIPIVLYKYNLDKCQFSKSLGKAHKKTVVAERLNNFLNIFSFCSLRLHISNHWRFENRMLCCRESEKWHLKISFNKQCGSYLRSQSHRNMWTSQYVQNFRLGRLAEIMVQKVLQKERVSLLVLYCNLKR